MAIVNSPYVGIARGRLGEGVFSRVKGQTTVRGYNPSPNNPRTKGQQAQRSQFSSAVRFFSRGVQNFFKFAFESKLEKESDYNAFMRYNSNRGIYFGPDQNATPEYPSVGEFIMTKGSLVAPEVSTADGFPLRAKVPATSDTSRQLSSMKELAEYLIAAGYQHGDIFTFVNITTDWAAGDESEPCIDGSAEPSWDIRQFTIDSASTVALSMYGIEANVDRSGFVSISMRQVVAKGTIGAYCITVSRNARAGLQVSTSVLKLNIQGTLALWWGQSESWRNAVLAAWGTVDDSILQGGVSVKFVFQSDVKLLTDPKLPFSIDENEPLTVWYSDNVTMEALARYLHFEDEEESVYSLYQQGDEWRLGTGSGAANYWLVEPDSDWSIIISFIEGTSPTPEDHAIVKVWWGED